MEANDLDINMKVALVLARENGWPIDYSHGIGE